MRNRKAISRRKLMKGLGAGAAVLAAGIRPSHALILPAAGPLSLSLTNLHTGESFKGVFAEASSFVPDALTDLNRVLRDHRTDEMHDIDPVLFVWMTSLRDRLGGGGFSIISGYRSPKSNAALRAKSGGVAKKSFHMQGRAIDLRLSGVKIRDLRELAVRDRTGGVGYYPASDFVHLDTGKPRFW